MTQRALITGAGGFVGTILAAHLAEHGWDVLRNDVAVPPCAGGWLAGDISRREDAERLFEWANAATHVFHLAAVTFVPDSMRNPCRTFEVNLQGTVNLTQAMRQHAPQARCVFIGSAEIYGPPQFLPLTEAHPVNPLNPYAISKAAADAYCAYLHDAEGFDVVRMRSFNHTGPGQSDRFVLSSFAHQIALIEAGKCPPILRVGNLETFRDFSHVNDVVRAYELAALKGHAGETYNVCSGRPVGIGAALDKLLSLSTASIRIEPDPARMRPVEVRESWGSHEKLTAHTGWEPRIAFDELLAGLLGYWRGVEGR